MYSDFIGHSHTHPLTHTHKHTHTHTHSHTRIHTHTNPYLQCISFFFLNNDKYRLYYRIFSISVATHTHTYTHIDTHAHTYTHARTPPTLTHRVWILNINLQLLLLRISIVYKMMHYLLYMDILSVIY